MTINPRILLSGASIVAATALGIGATFAFFSDSDVSNGNTLSSGTFEVEVNDNDTAPDFTLTIGSISNLAPGDTTSDAVIKVVNKGSVNAATFGRFTLSAPGTPDLASKLNIYDYKVEYFNNAACNTPTARWTPSEFDPYHGVAVNQDWFIKDGSYTLWNGVGGSEVLRTWVAGNGPLDIPGTAWDMEGLKSNECYVLTAKFQMDPTADNSYQGTSVTLGYEVKSGQINTDALNALGLGAVDMSVHIPYLQSQVTP